ncbi:hypothetical protein HIM_10821 [Hirsutella minnesotensis 3608]|uniref:Uncharacterized protein n=1 Tax=Hirsutella minnesotensis 3608 TaxID=1043627 RepID=A0A0F7ZWY5_9HYPO|nr:hypothetical protein HIM_10821 [Hirsutella minnesotensis 3608]
MPQAQHGLTPITPADSVRWLGMWFDSKLTFKKHVEHWAAKAKRLADFLRGLSGVQRGLQPRLARQAVTACKSGIPPAAQILQRKSALAGVRIRSLDRDHPLQPKVRLDTPLFEEWRRRGVRLPRRAWKQKFCSRLWRLLAQTPRLEPPPLPRPQPPSMDPTGGMSKAEGAQAFRDWLKRAEDTDEIIAYSDGLQTKSSPAAPGQTGYGFTVHRGGKEITADAASRFEAWWQAEMPDSYRALKLKTTTKCPKELVGVPRERLHHLLAVRSKHGDFAQYHERFNHPDALLVCSCGRRKAPDHIFYCRKIDPVRRVKLIPSAGQAFNSAIGPKYETFLKLVEETGFFQKICPRRQA